MDTMNLIKTNLLYIIVAFFLILLTLFFYMENKYTIENEKNFINAITQETNTLIELKARLTFDIANTLAGNAKLIEVMKSAEYEKLYDEKFFPIATKFKVFQNLALHIVDQDGVNRYLSWTKKSIGKNILNVRKDIRELYKNPKTSMNISVGKFDMTFKGIVPIYDEKNNFLGIIEAITHFNSISQHLAKKKIYTAAIIDKRFTKQLIHPFSKKNIDGYNISTLDLHKDVENFVRTKGVDFFINLDKYTYLVKDSNFIDGYYVVTIPLKGLLEETIGYFVIFIEDVHRLKYLLVIVKIILFLMVILFFVMTYLVYKGYRRNTKLVESLNQRVEYETLKNLELIYHDNLTSAFSKEKFEVDKRKYKMSEIIMLNIKNFSQINQTYGFKVGDEVLMDVARRLHDILNVPIYRIDSDEFLFSSKSIEQDLHFIKADFMKQSIYIKNENINIRLSFSFSAVHGDSSEILRKLTFALKQAKKEPYKDYIYHEQNEIKNDFIKFNSYLYDAIFLQKESSVLPYFQGIRDNKSEEIIKYEALARLQVKDEVYTPYFFLKIAKNSGYLYEITKIMIEKSFAFLETQEKHILLSINITEDDLLSKNLMKYLEEKLNYYNLDPSRITLEILEGISSSGTKNNIKQLKNLKALGFKLAIDDFGVEYSNFERIHELDIDFIKIDGVYIKNIHTNRKSYKIAKAIADFSSSMDIEVIAEFVENQEIQDIIISLGIEYSQGYLFSKPTDKML